MAKKVEHTVYRNDKGEKIPSVTTILQILSKNSLMGWSNYLGFKKIRYTDVLEQSCEIGTMTHKCIELYIKNKVIRLDKIENMAKYSGSYKNAMIAFKNFKVWYKRLKSEHDIEVISTEMKCTSKRYGGTIDFIVKIDGKIFIIDFKTSSDIYPSMYLQLAAYGNLFIKNTTEVPEYVAILRLDKMEYPSLNFHTIPWSEIEESYLPVFNYLLDSYVGYEKIFKLWGKKFKL